MRHGGVFMFDTLASQLGALPVIIICAFAFIKGDEPERFAAGAYVLGWFASLLAQTESNLSSVQYGIFAIDIVMLAVLVGLAWKYRRAWPVWASAFQLLSVMSHVVAIFDLRPPIGSVIMVMNMAGYGVLIAIGVGTFWAWQDRRAANFED